MNQVQRSFVAAGSIAIAAGACYVGSALRDRTEVGGSVSRVSPNVNSALLASRDNESIVPAQDFYLSMVRLVKEQFVEPVKDEQKLASGAVRGMVGSLGDLHSLYMDKDEFRAFLNARQGKYEGIGVQFVFDVNQAPKPAADKGLHVESGDTEEQIAVATSIPKLVVSSVVPNGPADRAGVKPGDVVEYIDSHWVAQSEPLEAYRKAQKAFANHQMTFPEISALQKQLRKKTERAIMPLRAKDRLLEGATGTLKVTWLRAGAERVTTIQKAPSKQPTFAKDGSTVRLIFNPDTAEQLKKAVAGQKTITFDLRGNSEGDFASMRKCLAVVAPDGVYGQLVSDRKDKPATLVVTSGNPHPPKMTFLVDRGTRGVAQIFALALANRGLGSLSGTEMVNDRVVQEIFALPDGSGYSLATSSYRVGTGATITASLDKRTGSQGAE